MAHSALPDAAVRDDLAATADRPLRRLADRLKPIPFASAGTGVAPAVQRGRCRSVRMRLRSRRCPQLDWPQGLGGRPAGAVMVRMNAPANRWAIDLLEVRPGDRVLDIGCGPGLAVSVAAARLGAGLAAGIDRSQVVIAQARRRNRRAIKQGIVQLQVAAAHELPFPDRHFTKACSVNALPVRSADLLGALQEVRRVLTDDAQFVIVLRTRRDQAGTGRRWDRSRHFGVTQQQLAQLSTALQASGFTVAKPQQAGVGGELATAICAHAS
jgi:ubiquinone/menaquinone biosynthesis C-methylase UbiE